MKPIHNLILEKALCSAQKNLPNKISSGTAWMYVKCENDDCKLNPIKITAQTRETHSIKMKTRLGENCTKISSIESSDKPNRVL
jgi:hypothetical protein